jgi:segregation and condensation protein A
MQVNEESVTVGQMIEYLRRRLLLEERPIRLKKILHNVHSRNALVCTFLAILELVRLQAILLRQDRLFGEIILKKHELFDTVLGEGSGLRDDWN